MKRVAEFYGVGDFLAGARMASQIPVFACVSNECEKAVVEANFKIKVMVGLDDVNPWDIARAEIACVGAIGPGLASTLSIVNPRIVITEKKNLPGLMLDMGVECERYFPQEFGLPQVYARDFCVLRRADVRPGQYFHFPDGKYPKDAMFSLASVLETAPAGLFKDGGKAKVLGPGEVLHKFPLDYYRYEVLVDDGHGTRRLSVTEAKRIQGFPEWFQIPATQHEAYRIVGKATWPCVIASLLQEIGEWIV